jgi:uncharacterized glyoxalase superfamily metalloenzyme YdcJ
LTVADTFSSDAIREKFAVAMSAMYMSEVPHYKKLVKLVYDVNNDALIRDPELKEQLSETGEIERLGVERHGAIRVGTAKELSKIRRLFAVMGMEPVGYYDLSVAGIPVHSTAFRPTTDEALRRNPFRIFTSLLRLDLIEDEDVRQEAAAILARRNIFTARCLKLLGLCEEKRELNHLEADEVRRQSQPRRIVGSTIPIRSLPTSFASRDPTSTISPCGRSTLTLFSKPWPRGI